MNSSCEYSKEAITKVVKKNLYGKLQSIYLLCAGAREIALKCNEEDSDIIAEILLQACNKITDLQEI